MGVFFPVCTDVRLVRREESIKMSKALLDFINLNI